jgi:hypothetical protein
MPATSPAAIPDQDVPDQAGCPGRAHQPTRVHQRGEDRLGRLAPQVVHDQVVGARSGDRRGQLARRPVDPHRGLGSARHQLIQHALGMLERTSRPRFRALILDRAGVTLDPDLAAYLVHIDLRGPIGVLELAELTEQNHPKSAGRWPG